MKYLTLTLLLLGSTVAVCAQSVYTAALAKSDNKVSSPLLVQSHSIIQYEPTKPPGLRMRNAGRMLTIGGAAMFIGGVILLNNADDTYYATGQSSYGGTYEEGDAKGALGVLMIVGGVGMTVPGIILWSKGSKKYNRYLEKQQASQASVELKGRSLSLSYRF